MLIPFALCALPVGQTSHALPVGQTSHALRCQYADGARKPVCIGLASARYQAANDAKDSRGNIRCDKLPIWLVERSELLRYRRNNASPNKAVHFSAKSWLDLVHQKQAGFRFVRRNETQRIVDYRVTFSIDASVQCQLHLCVKPTDKVVAHFLRKVEHIAIVRVKRAPRHAACRYKLAHRDLLKRFLRCYLKKRLLQRRYCAGGTLLVELGQGFVSALSPFLPFTYAIDGFREVITYADGTTILTDAAATAVLGLAFFVLSLATWRFAEKRRDNEMKSAFAWNM